MDEGAVSAFLAPYSPPLSPTQINEIANVIAEASEIEIGMQIVKVLNAVKARERVRKKSRKS